MLALDMISRAFENVNGGEKFAVEHVFSCEIEPFKQVSERCDQLKDNAQARLDLN